MAFKHLNIDERYEIQYGLDCGKSFKAIAREIKRDCRTIAREVCSYATVTETGGSGKNFNNCLNRAGCTVTRLDAGCTGKKRCVFCFKCCKGLCGEYAPERCPALQKAPYCCNSCKKRPACTLTKLFYRAAAAGKSYCTKRSEANKGIYADSEEIERINRIVSPLIAKGQSIHHICINHSDEIMLSEKTLYSYMDQGLFTAKNIDMPRKVRYRPRKCNHKSFKVDKKCRDGRGFEDMLRFIEENGDAAAVEMDTVEGKRGGKVLLTLFFTLSNLMLSFIRDANTARSVNTIFDDLYEELGHNYFTEIFPLLRTDNGSEFSSPASIEFNVKGERRTWIFYCDPYSSWQKSGCELNHQFIRRILPKGSSFDNLVQDDISLMMNHINSYKRKELNDKSPYELFVSVFGREVADGLGLVLIPSDDILLTPKLLQRQAKDLR